MTVIALTVDGKKIVSVTTQGPSSYTTGGFTVIVPELEHVHEVLSAFITGGYKIGEVSISGNTVKVVIHQYNYPSTTAGPSAEVPAGTNLSTQKITLIVVGI